MVRSDCSIVHFCPTNSNDRKQEKISYQRCSYKVQGEVQSDERLDFATPIRVVIMSRAALPWGYYSQGTQGIQDSVRKWSRDVYWDMKGEEYNDVCPK